MGYDLTVPRARDPLIAITVFAAVAVVTTGLRLRARKMRDMRFLLDDYFMLAALFTLFISIGIQFACVLAGGVGRHVEDVDPLDVVKTLKLILPFEALYGVTLCLIKVSIVIFYMRIFGLARGFRMSAYIAIGILVAWALSVILETFLLCRPLAFNWDPTIDGVCGDRNTVYVSAGALNVVTDFMVMALPIPHILSLQLKMRKKLGLVLMFSLGIFITIISIIRIKSLQIISFTDPTFTLPMGLLWTTLEPCLCIINANLPMTRTYLATKLPHLFGSTKDRTYGTGNTNGQRTQKGAYMGGSGSRLRADNFEMLGDERFEQSSMDESQTGGKMGTRSTVGRGSEVSIESQKQLTGGGKGNHIVVNRRVDIEG
ncbi:integral membrane protein [Phlyctema vagabunda]|uniref:Integral membrane protein n=1 Tax=Phlyctema vagabunda TaxID=108571 RepID=A0ABR4PC91_9HELO